MTGDGAAAGLRWTASDEGVLERSIQRAAARDSRGSSHPVDLLYRPWVRHTLVGDDRDALPRPHALATSSGSPTRGWRIRSTRPTDLLERIRARRATPGRAGPAAAMPLVPIILDGENALGALPRRRPDVPARVLSRPAGRSAPARRSPWSEAAGRRRPRGAARACSRGAGSTRTSPCGSATPTTGAPGTLSATPRDALARLPPDDMRRGTRWRGPGRRTAPPAGSDWCWWYGDDRSSVNDADFDRLFRRHLQVGLRGRCGGIPPADLGRTFITTASASVRRSARPGGTVTPTVDGLVAPAG